jgi:dTDP-4-amino-4,6-dideoxygalactose transaminase
VLKVKMAYIERWTEARRAVAAAYDDALAGFDVRTPAALADRRHVYHVYAIREPRRAELQAFLGERGIGTNIHYPIPVHLQKAFAELGHAAGDFPVSEAVADEVLSLPMYPELPAELQQRVIDALQEWSKTSAEVAS